MDTDIIATVMDGVPVHMASEALRCRHTVLVNRIKSHTKFKGRLESGLYKMLVVGLGKHAGAKAWHRWAIRHGYFAMLETMGDAALASANVRFGLAIVENAFHRPQVIDAVAAAEMKEREAVLLEQAKASLPRLPLRALDALVVGHAGKDISGAGMDPNITGRAWDLGEEGFDGIMSATRLAVLDLTEASGGNAIGIGYADFITRRFIDKMDADMTRINAMTSLSIRKGAVPIWLPSDKDALNACLTTIGPVPPTSARMSIIPNTRDLATFWVSEALAPVLAARTDCAVGEPRPLSFDSDGSLRWPSCHAPGDAHGD
jgi:hypothetical protein